MNDYSELKVSEAFQQDVGYGRARIDHQTQIDLDLSIGDIIEIKGSKTTAASVWRAHPSDEGTQIIRIDNLTRKNAGTGLGDRVKIKRAEAKEAKKVTLAPLMPTGQRIEFGRGIECIIHKNLLHRPLTHSDKIIITGIVYFGTMIEFEVIEPKKGVFYVGNNTKMIIQNKRNDDKTSYFDTLDEILTNYASYDISSEEVQKHLIKFLNKII